MSQIDLLDEDSLVFPPVENALHHPDGLLAAGGDLSPDRLIAAYQQGIFPWFEDGQPILWWSPDPRTVLFPDDLKVSKSLAKLLRQNRFDVFLDRDFERVIQSCSHPRDYTDGTWITAEMIDAYIRLHELGIAHCVSCYRDGELAGGLYGIGLGRLFFGESMFHTQRDASKVAFAHLVRLLKQHQCPIIDCQVGNPHLTSLGATEISRNRFCDYLSQNLSRNLYNSTGVAPAIHWQALSGPLPPW